MCVKPLVIKRKEKGMDAKHVNSPTLYTRTVPCGQCPECRTSKIHSWMFRLDKELERSTNPLFVTLTYNNESLSYGQKEPTLVKRDLQLFLKRLRKVHEKRFGKACAPIKYYACGEYGSKTHRPHYHIIMFNLLDTSLVHDSWGQGHTLSMPLRDGGTAYVLKYMSKAEKKKIEVNKRNFHFRLKEWVKTILLMPSENIILVRSRIRT